MMMRYPIKAKESPIKGQKNFKLEGSSKLNFHHPNSVQRSAGDHLSPLRDETSFAFCYDPRFV